MHLYLIVNCVGYIHDMELCIKDLLVANKSFKMILGAYGKGSLFAILGRTRGMFCEDQREVKRSPKEFSLSLCLVWGKIRPRKSVAVISITDLHVMAIS